MSVVLTPSVRLICGVDVRVGEFSVMECDVGGRYSGGGSAEQVGDQAEPSAVTIPRAPCTTAPPPPCTVPLDHANTSAAAASPPHHFEAPEALGVLVGVGAVGQEAGVVAVQHIIDAVLGEELVQELGGEVVRHVCSKAVQRHRWGGTVKVGRNTGRGNRW